MGMNAAAFLSLTGQLWIASLVMNRGSYSANNRRAACIRAA